MYQRAGVGGGGNDMSPLLNKVILGALAIGSTERFAANVIGITSVSFVFSTGQATTCSVHGYVGNTKTTIGTYSKQSTAQTVNVSAYERISFSANSSGTMLDLTVTGVSV